MSALSPIDQYGNKSGGSGYGSGQSESGKSPLSLSLGFLKNLTEKKSARADGQQPKRRGPKPDSKPALTRRQELNRQAQRTHRERKELYIKALEQEVLRLKENFSSVSRDKETLAEENRQLRQLLAQHGIPWTGTGGVDEFARNSSLGYTSSGSISGSYAPCSQSYSPPTPTNSNFALQNLSSPNRVNDRSMAQQQVQRNVDYDQAGIDFVLTYADPSKSLERPCMEHIPFLVERADDPEGDPTGHALMASCPPGPNPEENPEIPFGHGPAQLNGNAQKTWDLSKPDLANLLDLSKRLNLDGEITPVMAWGMVIGHPRFREFTTEDFRTMCLELGGKVRCYGFGAVLEEFEVRDALESILHTKPDMNMAL
ncbi:BZIP-type transcription factor [Diplocarpon rosae]|nr:BZIP-type transcription factor [Diplocarpon rosae]